MMAVFMDIVRRPLVSFGYILFIIGSCSETIHKINAVNYQPNITRIYNNILDGIPFRVNRNPHIRNRTSSTKNLEASNDVYSFLRVNANVSFQRSHHRSTVRGASGGRADRGGCDGGAVGGGQGPSNFPSYLRKEWLQPVIDITKQLVIPDPKGNCPIIVEGIFGIQSEGFSLSEGASNTETKYKWQRISEDSEIGIYTEVTDILTNTASTAFFFDSKDTVSIASYTGFIDTEMAIPPGCMKDVKSFSTQNQLNIPTHTGSLPGKEGVITIPNLENVTVLNKIVFYPHFIHSLSAISAANQSHPARRWFRPNKKWRKFFKSATLQMAACVTNLNNFGYVHTDVHLPSFKVNGEGVLLLGNLGTSQKIGREYTQSRFVFHHPPPELLGHLISIKKGNHPKMILTEKFDSWSLGVAIYVLWCNDYPYTMPQAEKIQESHFEEMLYNINIVFSKEDLIDFHKCKFEVPSELADVIKALLKIKPEHRISASEAFRLIKIWLKL